MTGAPSAIGGLTNMPGLEQFLKVAAITHAPTTEPIVPSWDLPSTPAESLVARAQAEEFARLLFSGMTGYVNLRGISPNKAGPHPYEAWEPINANLPATVGDYVEMCATRGYAAFLLPHPVRQGGGGQKDIQAQRIIPIDLDTGDIEGKVRDITAV